MLIVVEHRNVKTCTQALFNFKTLRCLDVFEIDSTKCWGNTLNKINNFVGSASIDANRETVDATKLFEKQGLTLHHGHCAFWTDVTKSEHRGSVAHDGNGVLANGVLM